MLFASPSKRSRILKNLLMNMLHFSLLSYVISHFLIRLIVGKDSPTNMVKPELDYTKRLLRSKQSTKDKIVLTDQVIGSYAIVATLVICLTSRLSVFISTYFPQSHYSLYVKLLLCSITSIVYSFTQIVMSHRTLRRHLHDAYKGIYTEIPPYHNFKSHEVVANSLHFSGYLVGYASWAHIILFVCSFSLITFIEQWSKVGFQHLVKAFLFALPFVFVHVTKICLINSASKKLFVSNDTLIRPKLFASIGYFMFFIDCFVGLVSCISRLIMHLEGSFVVAFFLIFTKTQPNINPYLYRSYSWLVSIIVLWDVISRNSIALLQLTFPTFTWKSTMPILYLSHLYI
ncbi:hypothetical protein ACOME3_005706 [Neoechinorhynchus agilis]